MVPEQDRHRRHELHLREPLAGAVPRSFRPRDERVSLGDQQLFVRESIAEVGRGGRWGFRRPLDPSRGLPCKRIRAPVTGVGVQRHEVGDDEGVFGDVDVVIPYSEALGLSAGVFGDTRQGVVETKCFKLL